MNLFFSPPVKTYSILTPHYQACHKVDTLISSGFVQFQLAPYDDANDPYYMIYSRIRSLKHNLSKLVQSIQQKYCQPLRKLSRDEKLITLVKMKQYMKDHHLDHLKYLDQQENLIEKKLYHFGSLSKNYDDISNIRTKIQEELDTLIVKLELSSNNYVSEEFVMLHGVCNNTDKSMVERLIFRKSRGHSYVIFKNRPNLNAHTSIFICLLNKNIYKHIGTKILAICSCNNINLYQLPNLEAHLKTYQQSLLEKLAELDKVIQLSGHELTRVLRDSITGEEDSLRHHMVRLSYLERVIYIICHSKHVGDPPNHVLLTIHVPISQTIPLVGVHILSAPKHKPRTIVPRLPCLFQSNILTQLFSTPKHNQILPSVFMFATVPILFGMMYSDIGHGLMLLALCNFLKVGPIFYMMAFMSIYCGVIYNEFFGMKIIRWGNLGVLQPIWGVAQNGLNFENSLKMKISMIIALVHMSFGGILKIVNEYKRKQYKHIIYDSLPKIILLLSTVGYLDFLIIYKWLTNYQGIESHAPSVINSVLELYLGWNQSRIHSILGDVQTERYLGSIIKYINLGCILIMLYNHVLRHKVENMWLKNKRLKGKFNKVSSEDNQFLDEQISQQLQENAINSSKSLKEQIDEYYQDEQQHESQLGPLEIFEYVLSLISSTTSYLRLFALSLAHAKLSHLLISFLLGSLSDYHPSISILRCFVFFASTCGMMLALDVMECLMHVVRLHWVEWMGKFYQGRGILFQPQIEQNYE